MHANEPEMAMRWEHEGSLQKHARGERRKKGKLASMTYKGKDRRDS